MDCKTKKYLHIYDWNYWWGYYRCGKDWDPFDAAEFSLSEDEAGETPFFHFDFHNLSARHQQRFFPGPSFLQEGRSKTAR